MGQTRIFVSHSNNDPDTGPYLEAISTGLAAAGFDVLIDRTRLEAGSEWRRDIYSWMGLCHGAVILLSQAALRAGSIWVPRETSILLWRRALDPDFLIIPVCLGSVTPANLTAGAFTDSQITELQFAAAGATPAALVEELVRKLTPLNPPKTPLEALASRVAELLRSVSDAVIEEAMDKLALDLGRWSPLYETRQKLAFAMLNLPLRRSIEALEILAESMESGKADQILEITAPAWVDLHAARHLAECGTAGQERRAVVLNGSTYFCAKMYVQRASCKPPKTSWPVISTTGIHGERVAEEIAAEIEDALIKTFRVPLDPIAPNAREQLRLVLEEYRRKRRPVFVAFRYSASVAGALRELQRMFPAVTFVFLSGEDFPPANALAGQSVRLIEPKLESGVEATAQTDFNYAHSVIRPRDPD